MTDDMPKSYDQWRTAGPQEIEHFETCPCADDAPPICRCRCEENHHEATGECKSEKKCLCEGWQLDDDPDCICNDLDD